MKTLKDILFMIFILVTAWAYSFSLCSIMGIYGKELFYSIMWGHYITPEIILFYIVALLLVYPFYRLEKATESLK